MTAAPETLLVRVVGRVQGVGFRESCVHEARALGVTGWVRNRLDGSVEALLQGSPDALARLRDWLRHGPPLARVDEVIVGPPPIPVAPCSHFELRPTA